MTIGFLWLDVAVEVELPPPDDTEYPADAWRWNDTVTGRFDIGRLYYAGLADLARDVRKIDIRRGRTRESDDVDVGELRITLDDRHRDYDPTYLEGPHGGHLVPGKRFQVSLIPTTGEGRYPLITGLTSDWIGTLGQHPDALMIGLDPLARPAAVDIPDATYLDEVDPGPHHPGFLPGLAIGLIAGDVGIVGALLQVDPGISPIDRTIDAGNGLAHLHDIARSDAGQIYAGAGGSGIIFRDRYQRLFNWDEAATPQVLFTDDTITDIYGADYGISAGVNSYGGVPAVGYDRIEVAAPTEALANDVTVELADGTRVNVVDQASIDEYGLYATTLKTRLKSAAHGIERARWHLLEHAEPELRVSGLEISSTETAAGFAALAQLDFGHRIVVARQHPGGGPPTIRECWIEGIHWQLADDSAWSLDLSLSDATRLDEVPPPWLWDEASRFGVDALAY